MAVYEFAAIGIDNLIVTGPDPFSSDASRNTGAIAAGTTLQIAPGGGWTQLSVDDDEGHLHDGDSAQDLTEPVIFNGAYWRTGTEIEGEYSYVIRPDGSSGPADDITIYVLEFDGHVQGIAADAPLEDGVIYRIVSGGSDDPSVPYRDLMVCFTRGTTIATPSGPRPVHALRAGDMVLTMDNGPVPLAWVGRQVAQGDGPAMPVRVEAGALDNHAPLTLSQQHRVFLRTDEAVALPPGSEVLVPVKALVGWPGIDWAPCERVRYYHLLFRSHQVIFANGAPVESMYPGPMALKSLRPRDRAALAALFPEIAEGTVDWPTARPAIRPGRWARLCRRWAHAA